jgi:predicted AAA+ superfamily ATPase
LRLRTKRGDPGEKGIGMEYPRIIEQHIKRHLFDVGKITVLYGPRQTGKTTLAKKILSDEGSERGYFNCEELPVREALMSQNSHVMEDFFGGNRLVVLDEAQSVLNIGMALKIWIDAFPESHIIATGSSSFDLANKINEPLTGRHYEFFLPPISFEEIAQLRGNAEVISTLNKRIIYGSYPEVLTASDNMDARHKLESLTTSYLYRDVLQYNKIKNPEVLTKILRALAHQLGGDVSYNEIANAVQIDRKTVMSYINLLEQAFIVFRLYPLTQNPRDEIKRLRKIYFYDNGIVNALTGNFTPVESGRDMGGLWENLMMSERKKYNNNRRFYNNSYYWRTHAGQEVDLVEEYDGTYHPYEFKWQKDRTGRGAAAFETLYGAAPTTVVNRHNFIRFVL